MVTANPPHDVQTRLKLHFNSIHFFCQFNCGQVLNAGGIQSTPLFKAVLGFILGYHATTQDG
jgi:hypothetical protein